MSTIEEPAGDVRAMDPSRFCVQAATIRDACPAAPPPMPPALAAGVKAIRGFAIRGRNCLSNVSVVDEE